MPFSSAEIIRAVERQGYVRKRGHGRRGSHHTWAKAGDPGELHLTVTIPEGRKDIPKGTLASILRQLGIDEPTLRSWMK